MRRRHEALAQNRRSLGFQRCAGRSSDRRTRPAETAGGPEVRCGRSSPALRHEYRENRERRRRGDATFHEGGGVAQDGAGVEAEARMQPRLLTQINVRAQRCASMACQSGHPDQKPSPKADAVPLKVRAEAGVFAPAQLLSGFQRGVLDASNLFMPMWRIALRRQRRADRALLLPLHDLSGFQREPLCRRDDPSGPSGRSA